MMSTAAHRPEALSRASARGGEWLDTAPNRFRSEAFAEDLCDGADASSAFAAPVGTAARRALAGLKLDSKQGLSGLP